MPHLPIHSFLFCSGFCMGLLLRLALRQTLRIPPGGSHPPLSFSVSRKAACQPTVFLTARRYRCAQSRDVHTHACTHIRPSKKRSCGFQRCIRTRGQARIKEEEHHRSRHSVQRSRTLLCSTFMPCVLTRLWWRSLCPKRLAVPFLRHKQPLLASVARLLVSLVSHALR